MRCLEPPNSSLISPPTCIYLQPLDLGLLRQFPSMLRDGSNQLDRIQISGGVRGDPSFAPYERTQTELPSLIAGTRVWTDDTVRIKSNWASLHRSPHGQAFIEQRAIDCD